MVVMNTDSESGSVDRSANRIGDDTDESRRAAMLRLAKYTAPAMLALLLTDEAKAVCFSCT